MQHSFQVQAAEGVALDSQQTAKMGQKPALESALGTLRAGSSAAAVQFQLQKSICGRPLLSSGGPSKSKGSGNVNIAAVKGSRQSGSVPSNVEFPQEEGGHIMNSRSDGSPSHPVLGSSPDSVGGTSPSYSQLLSTPPSFLAASEAAPCGREAQSASQPVSVSGDRLVTGIPALSSRGFDTLSNSREGTVVEAPTSTGIARRLSGDSPLAVSVCPRPLASSIIQPQDIPSLNPCFEPHSTSQCHCVESCRIHQQAYEM